MIGPPNNRKGPFTPDPTDHTNEEEEGGEIETMETVSTASSPMTTSGPMMQWEPTWARASIMVPW